MDTLHPITSAFILNMLLFSMQSTCGQIRFPGFNYSVSHGGNFVGIASEPVLLVGLDIISDVDFKQQPTPDLLNSLSSHFTYFEWRNITSAGNFNLILREFCRYINLMMKKISSMCHTC